MGSSPATPTNPPVVSEPWLDARQKARRSVRARRSPGIAAGEPFRGELGRAASRRGAGIQVLNPAPIAAPGARPEADRAKLCRAGGSRGHRSGHRPTAHWSPTHRSTAHRSSSAGRSLADRFRPNRTVDLEAGDRLARYRPAKHRLDLTQETQLVDADQRHGVALHSGAARPADPVHVILGDHRQLEVDDVRQGFDVEASGRDFRRDQDVDAPGLEIVQGPDSLALALVAVDRGRGDAVLAELFGEPVGGVLRPCEDQRLVDPAASDEVAEELALAFAVDRVDDLANQLDRGVAAGDLDGSVSNVAASSRISSEKVAENSRLWRCAGMRARMRRMSRMKPMSSIRSASSRTRISTERRSIVPCPAWSSSRPGVATTISGPARRARTWGSNPTPP